MIVKALIHYPDKDRELSIFSENFFIGHIFRSHQINKFIKVVETTEDYSEIWLEEYNYE